MTRFVLPFVVAAIAAVGSRAAAQSRPEQPSRPLVAAAEVMLTNVVLNRLNLWVLNADWARVSGASFSRNLGAAWEWDDDKFETNMLGHPFNGSWYFNAGRANGLGFLGSVPLVVLGSATWEYFGENKPPSRNDFVMTILGGVAVGEMFYRLGTSLRNNEARGFERTALELAALPLDPIGALNRLTRGEWSAVGANPAEHDPEGFVLRVRLGGRLASDSSPKVGAAGVDIIYSDPFRRPFQGPYDVFGIRISLGAGFDLMRASGSLFGRELTDSSARLRHIFAVNHRFDYIGNPAQYNGGQNVELGFHSRLRLSRKWALRTQTFGSVTILGAIDEPGTGNGDRTYDFGSGAGFRLQAGLENKGLGLLTLLWQTDYLHAVTRGNSDHVVRLGGIELTVPITNALAISAHGTSFWRSSRYAGQPRNRRDYPELRLFLVWTKTGFGPQEAP
jgi:hypothetical protein